MTETDLTRTVDNAIASMERGMAEIDRLRKENRALKLALQPFALAYALAADPIGDSDLDNEQPRSVAVMLGDCRKAASLLGIYPQPDGGVIVR